MLSFWNSITMSPFSMTTGTLPRLASIKTKCNLGSACEPEKLNLPFSKVVVSTLTNWFRLSVVLKNIWEPSSGSPDIVPLKVYPLEFWPQDAMIWVPRAIANTFLIFFCLCREGIHSQGQKQEGVNFMQL